MVEDYTMPEAFLMTIIEDMWNPGTYVVTEFAGYEGIDLVNIFYGGILVKFDEKDGDLCYLSTKPGENIMAEKDAGICIVKTTLPGGTTTTHKVVLAD